MAIALGTNRKLRVAHDFDQKPGTAKVAITTAWPLAISATGTTADGSAFFEPCAGANNGAYIGVGMVPTNQNHGVTALRNTIIGDFTGVVPGSLVFLDGTGWFTHTDPGGGARPVGIGFTPQLISLF